MINFEDIPTVSCISSDEEDELDKDSKTMLKIFLNVLQSMCRIQPMVDSNVVYQKYLKNRDSVPVKKTVFKTLHEFIKYARNKGLILSNDPNYIGIPSSDDEQDAE